MIQIAKHTIRCCGQSCEFDPAESDRASCACGRRVPKPPVARPRLRIVSILNKYDPAYATYVQFPVKTYRIWPMNPARCSRPCSPKDGFGNGVRDASGLRQIPDPTGN